MKKHQVGIVNVEDQISIEANVKKALSLVDTRPLPADANVAIKPNLCRPMSPETGATVDTRIVETVIKILKEQEPGCRIFIVESDTNVRSAEEVFDRLGYMDLAKKYDVELINLTKDKKYPVTIPFYGKNILFPQTLINCDYFISIAKMKTYIPYLLITCTMKNLFGCVPQKYKSSLHPFLLELTTGLCLLLKPDISMLDGIVCMEGEGPISGKSKQMNLLVCGNDAVSTDIVAARIMGFNPTSVPMVRYGMKQFAIDVDDVEILGKPIDEVRANFDHKAPAIEISLAWFLARCGLAVTRFGSRVKDLGDMAYSSPYLFIEKHTPDFLFYRLKKWAIQRYEKRTQASVL